MRDLSEVTVDDNEVLVLEQSVQGFYGTRITRRNRGVFESKEALESFLEENVTVLEKPHMRVEIFTVRS